MREKSTRRDRLRCIGTPMALPRAVLLLLLLAGRAIARAVGARGAGQRRVRRGFSRRLDPRVGQLGARARRTLARSLRVAYAGLPSRIVPLARSIVLHGVWSMAGVWPTEDGMEYGVLGVWSMEYGVWSMEYGVWSIEHGVWSMDRKGPWRRPQSKRKWRATREVVMSSHDFKAVRTRQQIYSM